VAWVVLMVVMVLILYLMVCRHRFYQCFYFTYSFYRLLCSLDGVKQFCAAAAAENSETLLMIANCMIANYSHLTSTYVLTVVIQVNMGYLAYLVPPWLSFFTSS